MEKKVVIHTLEDSLQSSSHSDEPAPLQNLYNKPNENLIKIKETDYSVIYFSLITAGFFAIIGLLGYFVYLDNKENTVKISVATGQEKVEAPNIKTIWTEASSAFGSAIEKENYIAIEVLNFDEAFKFSLNNNADIKEFVTKKFSTSKVGSSTEIEIEDMPLVQLGDEDAPLYGFYKDSTFIIAKDTQGFKDAIRNPDITKL